MSRDHTTWPISGVLILAVAAVAGYSIGTGSSGTASEAETARDDAYRLAYDRSLDRVEAIAKTRGLKSGAGRGIKAGRKTGGREGFNLGGGVAGLEVAQADVNAAEAAKAAAESEAADRRANCGSIPEAPKICPTSAELSEYQAAAAALAAPKKKKKRKSRDED